MFPVPPLSRSFFAMMGRKRLCLLCKYASLSNLVFYYELRTFFNASCHGKLFQCIANIGLDIPTTLVAMTDRRRCSPYTAIAVGGSGIRQKAGLAGLHNQSKVLVGRGFVIEENFQAAIQWR
jgi:hypothetical protein